MKCPICESPAVQAFRPFCSKRCADVDLAKWVNGSYAITQPDPEAAEELADELIDALSRDTQH